LIFISVLGFKVYKNVGLSVDEIEEKVKEGIEEIKNLNNEIESTQKEVVFTMGAIGESRSKETGNHVKRVAEYSKLFALYYGLSKEEAELLKQASPMHDIGKVAIPDAILNKPGRFDENEREIMNTHAMLGYEMLKHSKRPILKAAAIVAKEHHEKWDGTGYPNGIKGENIHIYGRITALADVFDALGSDRVYKKAWDDERIFSLFKEERGKHFDPKLVDIFFENLDEFKKIREKLKDVIN
jgi:response regulator RpfG family c-di-GMP phosphodiesterase